MHVLSASLEVEINGPKTTRNAKKCDRGLHLHPDSHVPCDVVAGIAR